MSEYSETEKSRERDEIELLRNELEEARAELVKLKVEIVGLQKSVETVTEMYVQEVRLNAASEARRQTEE